MGRYLSILRRRGALLPFVAAALGRLPISMAPLGMVLLIQDQRGAYSIAGVVTAAFAVGAAFSAPVWGRLMDLGGQSMVIAPLSTVSAVLLAVLATATVGGVPDVVLVGAAAGAGLTFPPISPAMRAAWRVVLESEPDRQAAYALEAVVVETIFISGPLLLSVLLLAPPAVPLLVTAGLLASGGVAYSCTATVRACRPERVAGRLSPRGPSPLRVTGVRIVLAVSTAMAIGFGLTDVGIAATAREELGDQRMVGLLFAAIATGSAMGGLWYGSRPWRGAEQRRLPVALAGFTGGLVAVGLLLTAGHPRPIHLLPVLFVAGLCVAPTLIIFANLVDRHGPPDRRSEAQSWLNTAFTSGSALGTALAGVAVDAGGPALAFLLAAAAVGVSLAGSAGMAWGWLR